MMIYWLRGAGLIAVLTLVGFGAWWLRLDAVSVVGISGDEQVAVEAGAAQYLNDGWTHRWPLSFEADELRGRLLAAERGSVQDIASIETRWLSGEVVVAVVPRTPAIAWKTKETVWELDREGVALQISSAPDPSLPLVVDTTGISFVKGDSVVPQRFIDFVATTKANLGDAVSGLRVGEATTELWVDLHEGYTIRMSTLEEPRQQLELAETAKQQAARESVTINEYIDVRLGHKAYYK